MLYIYVNRSWTRARGACAGSLTAGNHPVNYKCTNHLPPAHAHTPNTHTLTHCPSRHQEAESRAWRALVLCPASPAARCRCCTATHAASLLCSRTQSLATSSPAPSTAACGCGTMLRARRCTSEWRGWCGASVPCSCARVSCFLYHR